MHRSRYKKIRTDDYKIPEDKIRLVYEFVKIDDSEPVKNKSLILDELNIPKESFIVGAAGTVDWRKAPDIFLQLAAALRKKKQGPVFYFIWVGGVPSFELEYDIKKLGLTDFVRFVPATVHYLDYLSAFNVFAMVSRVDPYPIVCLDAGKLGKPVVCFDKAGGVPEFVENDKGFVVPYLDVESMAEAIIKLYENKNLYDQFSKNIIEKVKKSSDVEVNGKALLDIILRVLNEF